MKEVLKIINSMMSSLGLNYEYMEYTSVPQYPYFVGEYIETPSDTEDGLQESTFILTGFGRSTWLELEEAKTKIENHLRDGITVISESSSGVAVFYGNSMPIRLGDAELKKIQINLEIKEWKV